MSTVKKSTAKAGGLLGGIIFLVIGVLILWNNEGRTVQTQSAINEAMSSYTDVSSDKIDPKYDGKVIATKGKINLTESNPIVDSKFGIKITGVKLERKVEMYQWQEECTTDEDNVETCSYNKVWSDSLIDSTSFTKSGYTNPTSFKYESQDYYATNVKVEAFDLPERLLKNLSSDQKLGYENLTELYKNQVDGFKIADNYLTNAVNTKDYKIGDLRISYMYANPTEVSMLGVQKGTTLEAFVSKKGKTIYTITKGSYTGKELLNNMTKANNTIKWLLRVVGIMIVIGGIGSLFNPLTALSDKIPVLRSIVNFSTSLISTVAGLIISLLVIAIAWFRFRPALSITLLVIIIALIGFLIYKKKSNSSVKEVKTEEK